MGLAFPKVGKRIRTQRDADQALDRRESAKVRIRSEGQCEVVIQVPYLGERKAFYRCDRKAVHVMHLIGGRGKRGRGISALAAHKLHGCAEHHRAIDGGIGGKKFTRIGGPIPLWTDPYVRRID